MDDLVHDFDDWELRAEDKGKSPVQDSDEEEEQEEEYAEQQEADEAAAVAGGEGRTSSGASPASPAVSEAGDMTCAICLCGIPLENLALVKGCEHMYCCTCILHWALHKEEPWCPQCKQPFNYLLTYRTLDGELQDFPAEESVCLLKRARWFEQHLRFVDSGSASLIEDSRLADQMAWQEYAGDYDLADDEEIESFYFSSAAGRARVVLGNRRYGEGGFISGGRRQARPVVERKRSNKMGKSGEHAVVGMPPVPPSAYRTPNANGGRKGGGGGSGGAGDGATPSSSTPVPVGSAGADLYGSSPSGSGCAIYGSSPSGSGRRARRNARRAAMDAGLEAAVGSWGRSA